MTSVVNQPSTPQHSPPPSWNTGVCGWIPVFWWELVDASTWFMMDGYTKNRCVYLKTENSRLLKRKKLPWRWLRDMVPPRIPWVSREVTWWLWKLFCFGMNEIHQCSMTKVKKSSKYKLVSGFKYFFNLQPYLGKWSPIWRAYIFQVGGIQPPTVDLTKLCVNSMQPNGRILGPWFWSLRSATEKIQHFWREYHRHKVQNYDQNRRETKAATKFLGVPKIASWRSPVPRKWIDP